MHKNIISFLNSIYLDEISTEPSTFAPLAPLVQLSKYSHAKFKSGGNFMAIKVTLGRVGFKKSYVISGVGQAKILRLLTMWVSGSKKGPKRAYIIYEWSLVQLSFARVP